MHLAVNVGLEGHPLLIDFCQLLTLRPHTKRKYLKSTAIGQRWSVPVHKFRYPSHLIHYLFTGTQKKMIRVGKYYFCSAFIDISCVKCLYGSSGPNGHEHGCYHPSVVGSYLSRSVGRFFKIKRHVIISWVLLPVGYLNLKSPTWWR